jgi:hypothetical protein
MVDALGSPRVLLIIKILLTVATLGYSAIPAKFDSDETHLKNASWDPHARFHIVWQVGSYVYLALIALYLIWTSGSETGPLWLAALLAAAAYGGFWTAVWTRGAWGTNLVSKVNPVPNFTWNIGSRKVETDANVTLFTFFVVMLAAAILLLLGQ